MRKKKRKYIITQTKLDVDKGEFYQKEQQSNNEIAKKGAREISDSKSNIIEKRMYKRYTSKHT